MRPYFLFAALLINCTDGFQMVDSSFSKKIKSRGLKLLKYGLIMTFFRFPSKRLLMKFIMIAKKVPSPSQFLTFYWIFLAELGKIEILTPQSLDFIQEMCFEMARRFQGYDSLVFL